MRDLHVREWGDGDPAVLVHGSMSTGRTTWSPQRPLAERGHRLIVPDRRGYGASPELDGEDFEVDTQDVLRLLEPEDAHLVGHSYGALAALRAAARRPEAVRSLTVVEPPAFSIADDEPTVADLLEDHADLWDRAHDLDDRSFMERFIRLMGTDPADIPEALLDTWTRRTRPMRLGRPAWEADIPLAELERADLPVLVISGDHHPAFELVCDRLVERLGACRDVIPGAGHEVQRTGEPFNRRVLRHWREAAD